MNVLVVGGSGSGKSAFAEQLCCRLSPVRTYLATMAPQGPEAKRRIARHVQQRAGLGFATVECSNTVLRRSALPQSGAAGARRGVALLDDLGNLVANSLFEKDGAMHDPARVGRRLLQELRALATQYEHVVVVGNEVGSEGPYTHETTHTWVHLVGMLCCQLAAHADTVAETVAGVPHVIKGRIP